MRAPNNLQDSIPQIVCSSQNKPINGPDLPIQDTGLVVFCEDNRQEPSNRVLITIPRFFCRKTSRPNGVFFLHTLTSCPQITAKLEAQSHLQFAETTANVEAPGSVLHTRSFSLQRPECHSVKELALATGAHERAAQPARSFPRREYTPSPRAWLQISNCSERRQNS